MNDALDRYQASVLSVRIGDYINTVSSDRMLDNAFDLFWNSDDLESQHVVINAKSHLLKTYRHWLPDSADDKSDILLVDKNMIDSGRRLGDVVFDICIRGHIDAVFFCKDRRRLMYDYFISNYYSLEKTDQLSHLLESKNILRPHQALWLGHVISSDGILGDGVMFFFSHDVETIYYVVASKSGIENVNS